MDVISKVEIKESNRLYFCSHFYKSFKDKAKIHNASILQNNSLGKVSC